LNSTLSLSKLIVGVLAHSPALISDAAHSFSDIATDLVTYYAHKKAREPADFNNPFGYGKYESFGTTVVGGVLIATGIGVGVHSGGSLLDYFTLAGGMADSLSLLASSATTASSSNPQIVQSIVPHALMSDYELSPMWAAAMASASLLSKEYLYQVTLAAGRAANSSVVIANAHHHRSDAMSSAVALIGIAGAMALEAPWLDPAAGMIVAVMVMKSGYEISLESISELLDNQLPSDCIAELAHVCSSVPGVTLKSKKAIKAIKSGPHILVDVNITVDGSLSVSAAHQIGEHCRKRCMMLFSNIKDVRVHLDPDPRQEWDIDNPEFLLDLPKVYEDKIKALIKRKCPEVLGVSEMLLTYEQGGNVSVRINVILHPKMSIADANEISTKIVRAIHAEAALKKDRFPIRDVDIDLELSELTEAEKGLVVVPDELVKDWVLGSSWDEPSWKDKLEARIDPIDRTIDNPMGTRKFPDHDYGDDVLPDFTPRDMGALVEKKRKEEERRKKKDPRQE
jgi:cation diffusion facilitator family transporter